MIEIKCYGEKVGDDEFFFTDRHPRLKKSKGALKIGIYVNPSHIRTIVPMGDDFFQLNLTFSQKGCNEFVIDKTELSKILKATK